MAILGCMTSYLKKRLGKEQITICTDSKVAVAALGVSGTKSWLLADCIENLTTLSKVNRITIMWVPGHSSIQQKEATDRLAREGAGTRPSVRNPSCNYP